MVQCFNDPMIQWFNDSTSLKTKLSFARSFPIKVNLELQNETIRTFPWCFGVPSSKLKANRPRGSWVIIGHDIIHYNPMKGFCTIAQRFTLFQIKNISRSFATNCTLVQYVSPVHWTYTVQHVSHVHCTLYSMCHLYIVHWTACIVPVHIDHMISRETLFLQSG